MSAARPRRQTTKKKYITPFIAKRSEWADKRIAALEEGLRQIEAAYLPGPDGLRKKQDQVRAHQAEIAKFRRIASAARAAGN